MCLAFGKLAAAAVLSLAILSPTPVLAQTLKDIPAPVRYGVPAVLLCAAIWLSVGSAEGNPDYVGQAESLMRALAAAGMTANDSIMAARSNSFIEFKRTCRRK